ESTVLLKNANNFLPLDKQAIKSIAVIGPRANAVALEGYSGLPPYTVSPLDGIKKAVGPGVVVNYAADNTNGAAVNAAKASDVAVVLVGNQPMCGPYKGVLAGFASDDADCPTPGEAMENHDRKSIDLDQESLIQEVFKANQKTVVVLVSGFPYAINWTQTKRHRHSPPQPCGTGGGHGDRERALRRLQSGRTAGADLAEV